MTHFSDSSAHPFGAGGTTGGSVRRRLGGAWVGGFQLLVALVGAMWVLEAVDVVLGGQLDRLGIQARNPGAMQGIVFAPFLHAGFGHLISNTVPLLVLGAMIAFDGASRLLLVTAVTGIVSGAGAWLLSPPFSITIGASGVVFGFAAYLVVRGVFNRRIGQILVGLLVVFTWGSSLLVGVLPQGGGISWQGHLFGAVGGVLVAWLLSSRDRKVRRPSPSW